MSFSASNHWRRGPARRSGVRTCVSILFAGTWGIIPPNGLAISNASAAAIVSPKASHAAATHLSAIHERNPHLHGFVSQRPQPRPANAREHHETAENHDAVEHHLVEHLRLYERHWFHERWWAHHWYPLGDYSTWYVAHTGLGDIDGFIVRANNVGVANAQVFLRKPRGRLFRKASMKHITYADALGHFHMSGVHPGDYRVMAKAAGAQNHSQTHVDPGTVSRVAIQM